jgi:hypothetical protein
MELPSFRHLYYEIAETICRLLQFSFEMEWVCR